MWLYYVLKTISNIISALPYKFVVRLGKGCGRIYWHIAKKQRIRAEKTMQEHLGVSSAQAKKHIHKLFLNLGMTFSEIMYMPALNKDNIRGLVTFDHPDILWEAVKQGHGVVILACHMDNWEWLGAALALNGFPLSSVEKPQPNRVYSDFMNKLRRGVGQEIFSRGTSEILGCARAMKKGRLLGLVADQDGGYNGIFVPFLGKMASTPTGPAYFARKFNAPIIPIFIVRKPGDYGHLVIIKGPLYYEDTGDRKADDYKVTLKMTKIVEEVIKEYPDNWIWFQHRWNTPYEGEEQVGREAGSEKS
ncbi:MAG: lysophospholipid acyltransferase family protein [Acidaminococcaceae bacterium]|nr:lysophospholipid acyltransferase family protein [Acidaminococcaceae bacterium]